jgi:hypothetical protein
LYVTLTEDAGAQDRAVRIFELKPHVAPAETQDAVTEIDAIIARRELGLVAGLTAGGGAL